MGNGEWGITFRFLLKTGFLKFHSLLLAVNQKFPAIYNGSIGSISVLHIYFIILILILILILKKTAFSLNMSKSMKLSRGKNYKYEYEYEYEKSKLYLIEKI